MEKQYSDANRGRLFANKVKKNEKSPDYSGEITLDLKALGLGSGEYKVRLSGWKKTSKQGTQYLSLSVGKFEEKSEQPVAADDSDIPF